MFGRLLARGVPAETRRYIGSNTAYLTRDQPLTALTIKCLAARTSSALPALVLPSFRCYATAPKSTTAKKTTTSKKAPATKSTTKPKPKTATKSKAKPKAKAKPKKKPAAKRKKTTTKRKPKTEKTELQKKRTKVNQLRKIALLHPPKLLPTNSFLVYSAQHKNAGAKVTENAKANGAAFRNLSASEKEVSLSPGLVAPLHRPSSSLMISADNFVHSAMYPLPLKTPRQTQ